MGGFNGVPFGHNMTPPTSTWSEDPMGDRGVDQPKYSPYMTYINGRGYANPGPGTAPYWGAYDPLQGPNFSKSFIAPNLIGQNAFQIGPDGKQIFGSIGGSGFMPGQGQVGAGWQYGSGGQSPQSYWIGSGSAGGAGSGSGGNGMTQMPPKTMSTPNGAQTLPYDPSQMLNQIPHPSGSQLSTATQPAPSPFSSATPAPMGGGGIWDLISNAFRMAGQSSQGGIEQVNQGGGLRQDQGQGAGQLGTFGGTIPSYQWSQQDQTPQTSTQPFQLPYGIGGLSNPSDPMSILGQGMNNYGPMMQLMQLFNMLQGNQGRGQSQFGQDFNR